MNYLLLVDEIQFASIPLSPFYIDSTAARRQQLLRFAFCKDMRTLEKARQQLLKLKKIA